MDDSLVLDKPVIVGTATGTEINYSEICLKRPLKIDKIKVVKTGGSLVQVESIAEYF